MKNAMEGIVAHILKEHVHHLYLPCTCEECQQDVAALALNQLPSHYVRSTEGEAYIRAKYMEDQEKGCCPGSTCQSRDKGIRKHKPSVISTYNQCILIKIRG
ncbi:late competence development ComFB family protein [Bacillus sp. FJAT-44742]|uniref:late competence development ComFB family protein n=1 Tax=Bacillus sp. FJAT-44742 TaxID=2014005 RepID=UPI0012FE96BC|nr:late competence development ComFB family protein [Bacillus sp. FJAT-44742]